MYGEERMVFTMEELEMGVDILTLVDDDGNEHEFEVADTLEQDGKRYMALVPIFDGAEDLLHDDGELVVLQVVDKDGEEFLEAIADEAEFDKIAEIFMNNLQDDYDFVDADEEE